MNCHKCRTEPMKTETHAGVDFERCPVCKGMHFDKGELERMIAAGPGVGDSLAFSATSDAMDSVTAHCHACGVDMDAKIGPAGLDLHIDECPKCGAIFLDEGELATLQLHSS